VIVAENSKAHIRNVMLRIAPPLAFVGDEHTFSTNTWLNLLTKTVPVLFGQQQLLIDLAEEVSGAKPGSLWQLRREGLSFRRRKR
jgi:hypothetical protein